MDEREEAAARLVEAARTRRLGVRAAREELEHAGAAPAAGRAEQWGTTVADRLARLAQAWEYHVEVTEAPGGLFDEIIGQAPRLAHRVELLRVDHVAIRDAIADTTKLLTSGPLRDDDVSAVRDGIVDVLAGTARHRHAGADAVYEAFNVDIEAGD